VRLRLFGCRSRLLPDDIDHGHEHPDQDSYAGLQGNGFRLLARSSLYLIGYSFGMLWCLVVSSSSQESFLKRGIFIIVQFPKNLPNALMKRFYCFDHLSQRFHLCISRRGDAHAVRACSEELSHFPDAIVTDARVEDHDSDIGLVSGIAQTLREQVPSPFPRFAEFHVIDMVHFASGSRELCNRILKIYECLPLKICAAFKELRSSQCFSAFAIPLACTLITKLFGK
jgi:hypothetical protein